MYYRDLTKGKIIRLFVPMAIPLILSSLLSQAFQMVDMVIVGKVLGEGALAALGGTATLIELISSLFWGFGTGVALYVAVLFGAGKTEACANAIKLNLWLIFGVSAVVAAGCVAATVPIFSWLCVQEEVFGETFAYYAVYLAGFPFMMIQAVFGYLFVLSFGNSQIPLVVSLCTAVGNIGGNLFFLYFTPLEVAGVALSSALTALLAVVVDLVLMRRLFRKLGVSGQKMKWDKTAVIEGAKYGVPCMIQQSALYLSSVAVQPLVNGIGVAATAGYTAAMKLYAFNATIFQSASKCVSSFAAQCLGAGKYGRVRRSVLPGILQSWIFTLPVSLFCLIYPEISCGIFFREAAEESMSFATAFIPLCVPFFLVAAINNLFHAFFRGCRAMKSVIFSTALYTAVRIAASYLLVSLGMGITGVYAALDAAWVAEGITVCVLFLSGRWRPKELAEWELAEKSKQNIT